MKPIRKKIIKIYKKIIPTKIRRTTDVFYWGAIYAYQILFRIKRLIFSVELDFGFDIYNYSKEHPASLEILCRGLDEESVALVKLILVRIEMILKNRFISDSIFTIDEKGSYNTFLRNSKQYNRDYRGFEVDFFSPETFYYHSGLQLLDDLDLSRIENKNALDCGAYSGDSSLVFSRNYKFHKIFAFEPEKNNYEMLRGNIKRLRMKNVEPINCGVSDKNGRVLVYGDGMAASCSFIHSENAPRNKEYVELKTLDSFCEENKITGIGVIKMDVEGAEYKAIVGATEIIKRDKPILLISIYHTGKDFFEIKPYLESLNLGYKFKIVKLNPASPYLEIMLLAY